MELLRWVKGTKEPLLGNEAAEKDSGGESVMRISQMKCPVIRLQPENVPIFHK